MADQLLGGIVINEVLVDPNGAQNFDTDGNGTASDTDEFVELFNASGSAIDISGLQLWDSGVGNWFTFPPGTVLQPGGHAVVLAGVQSGGALPTGGPDDLFFDAGRGAPVINNGGDNITLLDPGSGEFIQSRFNGDALDDPTAGTGGYAGFGGTTRIGAGENFGSDTDGESLQRDGDGADTFTSGTPTPGTTNVCFADGAFIQTPDGPVAVEDLAVGDMVITADAGAQPVVWLYRKTWTTRDVVQRPHFGAVVIRAGALGAGCPTRDLRLSRQHRVLVQGAIARRMFGEAEVLIPAKALLALDGVSCEIPHASVTYYHVMLGDHQVIYANGVACESLLLGPQAIASIPKAAMDEVYAVLGLAPDTVLSGALPADVGPVRAARTTVQGRRAKQLVVRHARNGRALTGTPMGGRA